MVIKYKVSEVAKDLNKPAKQIIDLLAARGGEPKKTASNLDEAELNYIFEHFTKETEEPSLDAYLDSAPKPKPKESEILKKADGTVVEMPRPKHKAEKKPETEAPAPKREVVTILRAVHKYKDSREQFERRTHKRLIDIVSPTQKTVEALMSLELPAGVEIEIKL